jgi:hypothetical protein
MLILALLDDAILLIFKVLSGEIVISLFPEDSPVEV